MDNLKCYRVTFFTKHWHNRADGTRLGTETHYFCDLFAADPREARMTAAERWRAKHRENPFCMTARRLRSPAWAEQPVQTENYPEVFESLAKQGVIRLKNPEEAIRTVRRKYIDRENARVKDRGLVCYGVGRYYLVTPRSQ